VLDYISEVADWLWYLSFGCWLIIFILAWVVLFKRR
jgi:hypothetical protein